MFNRQRYERKSTYCPVCHEFFGFRTTNECFRAHCSDCKTTFTWIPWSETPKSELDKRKKEGCNCGHCGR